MNPYIGKKVRIVSAPIDGRLIDEYEWTVDWVNSEFDVARIVREIDSGGNINKFKAERLWPISCLRVVVNEE
jgi:hypothetical protein